MFPAFDLLRLTAAFALLYVALPYAAMRVPGGPVARTLALAFVRTAFFVQASAMVLGDWRLYLPGSAAVSYAAWLGVCAIFARRRRGPLAASLPSSRAWLTRFYDRLDRRARPAGAGSWRQRLASPVALALTVIAAAGALRAVWFSLHHVRLQHLESYTRAISLNTLMRGELWNHDGGVAPLALPAWLSGVTPDAAIRFAGAPAAIALTLAAAWCAQRHFRSGPAAVAAAAIFAGLTMALGVAPVEASGTAWSAVFLILAAGFAGEAWGTAALAALTAALLHPGMPSILAPLAAVSVVAGSLIGSAVRRVPPAARLLPVTAAFVTLAAALAAPIGVNSPEHQYEAAARATHRIAREFRTNDWIVISPGLEVAQTFGRGWHVELAEFVGAHREEQLRDPAFRFSYAAGSVFVFVEKRVLPQPAFSFSADGGSAPYYYTTSLGRASLEFRAAALMAAYVSAHDDTRVFFEDDDIIVYRIDPPPVRIARGK